MASWRRAANRAFARSRQQLRRVLPPSVDRRAVAGWNAYKRWYRHRRADVCLVSYPKAGRTWLRFLIGHALTEHFGIEGVAPTEIERLHDEDRRIPRIRVTHDDVRRPHVGEPLDPDKSKYARHSVILLVRDPRDILVSSYHHLESRDLRFTGSLADFVDDPSSTWPTILTFHQQWRDALSVPRRLLVVRYEDLREDPAAELRRVLDFLGLYEVSRRAVQSAVEAGRFDRMQEAERRNDYENYRLRPRDPSNTSSFKVRRGKVGGYVDEMSGGLAARLDRELARAGLEVFGYPSSERARIQAPGERHAETAGGA